MCGGVYMLCFVCLDCLVWVVVLSGFSHRIVWLQSSYCLASVIVLSGFGRRIVQALTIRCLSGPYYCHFNALMRATASWNFSSLAQRLMRMYLSPFEPKMNPGVMNTLAS